MSGEAVIKFPVGKAGEESEGLTFVRTLVSSHERMCRLVVDLAEVSNARAIAAEKALLEQQSAYFTMRSELEEILSLRQERELQAAESKQGLERNKLLLDDLRVIGKLIGKKWLGLPLTDGSALQDLLKTISPEQFEELATTKALKFTDAQIELLAQTLKEYAEKEAAEKAATETQSEPEG